MFALMILFLNCFLSVFKFVLYGFPFFFDLEFLRPNVDLHVVLYNSTLNRTGV